MKLIAQSLSGAPREFDIDFAAKPLGEGGGGYVYRDTSSGARVVKILKDLFDPATRKVTPDQKVLSVALSQRLDAMLRQVPDCMFANSNVNFCQVAWPLETVSLPNGNLIGFSMPLINETNTIRFEVLSSIRGRRDAKVVNNLDFRLGICGNLSQMVQSIHNKGHAIVDLRAENILVEKALGHITLIDCDGYRIQSGSTTFLAPLVDFTKAAPEIQLGGPQVGDELSDRFALAFLIFELLNNGVTPYHVLARNGVTLPNSYEGKIKQGLYGYSLKPHPTVEPAPKSSHRVWPLDLRRAFDRAFLGKPSERPSAGELAQLCKKYFDTAKLCLSDKDHGHAVIEGQCWMCAVTPAPKAALPPTKRVALGAIPPAPAITGVVPNAPILSPQAQSFYNRHQTPILTAICSVLALMVVSKWVNAPATVSNSAPNFGYEQGVADATAATSRRIAELQAAASKPVPTERAVSPTMSRLAQLQNGQAQAQSTPAPQNSETGRTYDDQHHGEKGTRFAVSSSDVNIRVVPGPNESLVGVAPLAFGTQVRILERQIVTGTPDTLPKFWFQIEAMDGSNRRGWVNSELLRKFLPNTPAINGDTGKVRDLARVSNYAFPREFETSVQSQGLNVRPAAGDLVSLLARLPEGARLTALSGADLFDDRGNKIAEWWRVRLSNGQEGWINAEFVD